MIGLVLASLPLFFILAVGTFWAFSRGAGDFHVFYVAWEHVLHGTPMQIYSVTPDRFLYAPGFAWLLSPLALLPENWSLGLWCFCKAVVVGLCIRFSANNLKNCGFAALGVLLLARPVLIDLQYGQVNLFILGSSLWALRNHFEREDPVKDFLSWLLIGIAAAAKLFPLPLLLVPFFVTRWKGQTISSTKLKKEMCGAILGVTLTLLIPLISIHFSELRSLMGEWQSALLDRGLPLESHNQSFSAFLHHYLSGEPTEIIALHRKQLFFGSKILAEETVSTLSLAWSLFFAGIILAWILIVPGFTRALRHETWIATLIALQILPSHLIWKPYFVMGLPLACLCILRKPNWFLVGSAFLLINFSGFDFLGQTWGAGFESASVLLWAHFLLFLIAFTWSGSRMLDSNA